MFSFKKNTVTSNNALDRVQPLIAISELLSVYCDAMTKCILVILFDITVLLLGFTVILLYRPHHAKMCLRAYTDNIGPDQPVRTLSPIRIFAVRQQNLWILPNI